MASFPPYIIDTNAFIESKNRWYAFDICPSFWDFMIENFAEGHSMSIRHVYDELCDGNDVLKDWINENLGKKTFVDCLAEKEVMSNYRQVAEFVQNDYKENVAADFLGESIADPWLVAYAMTHGGCIVTQETPKPSKRKASLVDVCDHFSIHHINIIDFLHAEKARFVYEKSKQ